MSKNNQFKVFTDEHHVDQQTDLDIQWKRSRKQQKNKQLIRVLIVGAVIIGLIFALALNIFLKHQTSHIILDNSDPNYTYIQTTHPHLKVLVSKNINNYQTKMVRALGIVHPALVTYLESVVKPHMKVLLVPNQNNGVNMLGMTVGYFLETGKEEGEQKKGILDVLVRNSQEYSDMTIKNIQLLKKQGRDMPVNIIKSLKQLKNYDLAIIQNNDFHQDFQLTKFQKVVIVNKGQKTKDIASTILDQYKSYQILKGKSNSQIKLFQKQTGYSLIPYWSSQNNQQKSILFNKMSDPAINLCEQATPFLQTSSQLRNIVQFFRNKTVAVLVLALSNQKLTNVLQNFQHGNILLVNSIQQMQNSFISVSRSSQNYFVMQFQTVKGLNLQSRPPGTFMVEVKSMVEARKVMEQFNNNNPRILSPYNNNGCFYPPHILGLQDQQLDKPYFMIV